MNSQIDRSFVRGRAVLVAGTLGLLLAVGGCGASGDASDSGAKAADGKAASREGFADGPDGAGAASAATEPQADGKASGKKAPKAAASHVIRTATLSVEAKSVPKAVAAARAAAEGAGGLVASENTERLDDTRETSHLVLRVPQERFGEVLRELSGSGKLLARTSNAKDVTDQVVDVESRISTQRASVARVRELMDKAERISDVVALEGELSSRQADLESLLAQQASLKDRTSLATITLDLTPPDAPGDDGEEKDDDPGFLDALGGGWDAFVTMLRWIAVAFGATFPFLLTAALGVVVWRVLRGRREARRTAASLPARSVASTTGVRRPPDRPGTVAWGPLIGRKGPGMAAERLVVIGGDAAGMSAASQARRLKGPDELEIVAFERGHFTSYSACGIPYWVSGDVGARDDLIARTPEEHRERSIDLRMRTEVTGLDVSGRRVRALDRESGEAYWTGYDKLVIATGARPVRPELPGMDAAGVHGVQTLDDGQALLDSLDALGTEGARRAVVVGAGYIGVEMAEAMLKRGFEVTVLNRGEQPMATLDPDMGRLVHEAMDGLGITTVNGAAVTEILTGADGRVTGVATDAVRYPADVVVLGIGVEPETGLAREAGLPLGPQGGLLTDQAMRVVGHEDIWAGGDCVEVLDLVSGLSPGTSRWAPTPTSTAR